MSIQKLITLNILFSPGKPNNTHSLRWSKLEISNSLIFVHHLNQYFQNLFALSHLRWKCWMSSSSSSVQVFNSFQYIVFIMIMARGTFACIRDMFVLKSRYLSEVVARLPPKSYTGIISNQFSTYFSMHAIQYYYGQCGNYKDKGCISDKGK